MKMNELKKGTNVNPTPYTNPNHWTFAKSHVNCNEFANVSPVLIWDKIWKIQYIYNHITGMSFGDESRKLLEDETAIGSDWDKWETVSQWTH